MTLKSHGFNGAANYKFKKPHSPGLKGSDARRDSQRKIPVQEEAKIPAIVCKIAASNKMQGAHIIIMQESDGGRQSMKNHRLRGG